MKDTTILTLSKSERPIRTITEENKHTFPEIIQDAFEKTSRKEAFLITPKYLKLQELAIKDSTCELFRKNAELSLRLVIIIVLQQLPDFLPADNLVYVTDLVLKEWKKLQEDPSYSQRKILFETNNAD